MKKIVSALLFLTSASQISLATQMPKELQSYTSIEEFEVMAHRRHPSEFKGAEDLDLQVVSAHRANHVSFDDKASNVFYSFDDPAIYPIAQKLENSLTAYAQENPLHIPTKRFLRELQFHKEGQDISLLWLLMMPFRFAASISHITPDESNLFAHVPFPQYFFGMLKKDAWQNSQSTLVSIDQYENEGLELSTKHISYSFIGAARDRAIDAVKTKLPSPVLYPMLGHGKFGVSFMVKSHLDDISPFGFPQTGSKGHGVDLSELGFPVHDLLHHEADLRHFNLISHVVERGEAYVVDGGDAWQFAIIYPPVAAQRYQRLMGALKEVYGAMLTKLLPQRGIREYRKAMVGFFWIGHEAPNFPAKLYNMNDFDQVLKTITMPSKLSAIDFVLDDFDSWESSFDPLVTSPVDGSTSLTDEEIYNYVLDSRYVEDAQIHKYLLKTTERNYICPGCIVDENIVRSNRFIDVIFRMADGRELKYSFPTLYHKWLNMDDNIGLLRYGGTKVVKPDLATVQDPRDLAQKLLDQVHSAILGHVQHFYKVAFFFSNYDPEGYRRSLQEGTSIAQRYFRKHFSQEQTVKKALEQFIEYDD